MTQYKDALGTAVNYADTTLGDGSKLPKSTPSDVTGAALFTGSNPGQVQARPPLTYTKVAGSPFTLTSSWAKVVTTTSATKGLRIAPLASASAYDIEWVSVTAGASAPTDTNGEPVFGGEDFAAGLPIGDIYLKSASGQVAIVKTGA